MKLKVNWSISLIVLAALFLCLWWGIPTYRKVKADAIVNELCAKDGGIKVYETVKLPASRFDQYGNVRVPNQKYRKTSDDFYFTDEQTWLVRGSGGFNDLEIWRNHYELYRSIDTKKLAESTSYARSGGDPPSPAHPSSCRCPEDVGFVKKVFIRD